MITAVGRPCLEMITRSPPATREITAETLRLSSVTLTSVTG